MTVAPIARRSQAHRAQEEVGRRPVLLLVVLGLSCAVFAWLRIPAIARHTLWAEGGRTFSPLRRRAGGRSLGRARPRPVRAATDAPVRWAGVVAQLAAATAECRRDDELRFVNRKETIGWRVTVP